jgi:predicted RNA-binding Zn-ribbon protein involved in translation (DUF1610 family)
MTAPRQPPNDLDSPWNDSGADKGTQLFSLSFRGLPIMPIVSRCPCGCELRLHPEMGGRRMRCPECGHATIIPKQEPERRRRYVTSFERLAMQEGLEKGRLEGLLQGLQEGIAMDLQMRFGAATERIMRKVLKITEVGQMRALARRLKSAKTLDEIRPFLP